MVILNGHFVFSWLGKIKKFASIILDMCIEIYVCIPRDR